ncbi:MAG: hypothetical protein R6W95_05490 [Desulfosarcina sp.]
MAWAHLQKSRPNGSLDELITFFAATVAHLPEVKLDKLIYIAHLYHYADVGELLTPIRFFSLAFGPHAPTIRVAVKALLEGQAISMVASRTSSDPVYSNPCLIVKAGAPMAAGLASSQLRSMQEVLQEWGDQPYERILDFSTRTVPYLSTPYREPIDWAASPPCRELKRSLSLAQRAAIHQFVDQPQAPLENFEVDGQADPLSISEVAEIYLALAGGRPESLPDREHLGFDRQAVSRALTGSGAKTNPGLKVYPDEIAEAAQITDALFSGLCFKNLSARVALIAGMLFLKKCGYVFDGNVLESRWPPGHSRQIFQEWFWKVGLKVDTAPKSC